MICYSVLTATPAAGRYAMPLKSESQYAEMPTSLVFVNFGAIMVPNWKGQPARLLHLIVRVHRPIGMRLPRLGRS